MEHETLMVAFSQGSKGMSYQKMRKDRLKEDNVAYASTPTPNSSIVLVPPPKNVFPPNLSQRRKKSNDKEKKRRKNANIKALRSLREELHLITPLRRKNSSPFLHVNPCWLQCPYIQRLLITTIGYKYGHATGESREMTFLEYNNNFSIIAVIPRIMLRSNGPIASYRIESRSMAASSICQEERHALLQSGWWGQYPNISDHCHWKGIYCNEAASVIHISSSVLTIPPSKELRRIQKLNLTAFPHLESLLLYGMGLTGTIPQPISTLKNLTVLDLSRNRLHGSIPIQLANLSQLTRLSLYNNSLTGSIPYSLGQLKNLQYLYLDSNKLEGSTPLCFEHFQTDNSHYVIVPSEFCQYNYLMSLSLLSPAGSIPTQLANLTQLKYLYLYNNLLTGSIPSALCQLKKLVHLDFQSNILEGSIFVCFKHFRN
ncbi:hypothetical protein Fmac_011903 [Flemingia macrophylla]|uniref:Leucine-rich repeat-containing N-terminal plant-type domain-containing protein n=1 Tax=Flemingia macrophylla TaxID=520843 RepID=A0ABD1MPL8_9FABA